MQHSHDHPVHDSQRRLKIGMVLTLMIFVWEFSGGIWTHSLALMSDAWHIMIDLWSLIVSYLALRLAARPGNDRQTFGLHRMEVLAALANGLAVFVIAVGLLYAAWRRWQMPVVVQAAGVMKIAGFGLLLNLSAAALFAEPAKHDMNMHGAFLHMLGDALNTVAVLVAAALIWITGSPRIDPIVSSVIALIVLYGASRLIKDALNTLLEGVPRGMHVRDVEREILNVQGVVSVHDLHVWSICSHLNTLSGHVMITDEHMTNQYAVLDRIEHQLKDHFGIVHTTIQVESKDWPTTRGAA